MAIQHARTLIVAVISGFPYPNLHGTEQQRARMCKSPTVDRDAAKREDTHRFVACAGGEQRAVAMPAYALDLIFVALKQNAADACVKVADLWPATRAQRHECARSCLTCCPMSRHPAPKC